MSEKNNKKPSIIVVGYLLIAGGILSVASSFIGEISWNVFSMIKLTVSVLAILFGIWMVLKKK